MGHSNISNFAAELTELTGQLIVESNVHSSNGRYYYIQPPAEGAPMYLHHYRGPFFVDLHPNDWKRLYEGEISAHEYILSANWLVGYYWGGHSMINGGYYQPIMDIIGRQNEVRRYLQILKCRGYYHSGGYMPTEEDCSKCVLKNCPFSKFQNGNWDNEMEENDPRIDLCDAFCARFAQEFPDFDMRGFLCADIPENEAWLTPNARYFAEKKPSFKVYVPESVIRSLLMHELEPEDWNNFANVFKVSVHEMFDREGVDATEESIAKACELVDYTKKSNMQSKEVVKEKEPFITRAMKRVKHLFF